MFEQLKRFRTSADRTIAHTLPLRLYKSVWSFAHQRCAAFSQGNLDSAAKRYAEVPLRFHQARQKRFSSQ